MRRETLPKTDYYDDPQAPQANSLLVAVSAIVQDESGRLLMIERIDNGLWAVPGGAQEIGDTTRSAVVREVREETGLTVEVTGIVDFYSDPQHVIAYDDGEVRRDFSIVFQARPVGGELRTSSESRRVHWIQPDHIDRLAIDSSMRLRIQHALKGTKSRT